MYPYELPIFIDHELDKVGMFMISESELRVEAMMGRVPPFFDPDNAEENARHKKACFEMKKFIEKFRRNKGDYIRHLADPFWLDPVYEDLLTIEEYREWQKKYMMRHPERCYLREGLYYIGMYKIKMYQIFPELDYDEIHDLPERIWNNDMRFETGTFQWYLEQTQSELGFTAFYYFVRKNYKKQFPEVKPDWLRDECEKQWRNLPEVLKKHYNWIGFQTGEYSEVPPHCFDFNPYVGRQIYPFKEARRFFPKGLGLTDFEERIFRLGPYSKWNRHNKRKDLFHEFLFFGGPKHEVTFMRDLDCGRPLVSAWGTDPESGKLFIYNPMFATVERAKALHDRREFSIAEDQDDLKLKRWCWQEDKRLRMLAEEKMAAQNAVGHARAGMTWKEIAMRVSLIEYPRTAASCQQRWKAIKDGSYYSVPDIISWENFEITKLVAAVRDKEKDPSLSWEWVAKQLPGRSVQACQNQYKKVTAKIKRKESKYVGISWFPRDQKWEVRTSDGKRKSLVGKFADEVEAAKAYDTKVRELKGQKGKFNFPLKGEKQAKKQFKWTSAKVSKMWSMKENGKTAKQIAEKLGTTVSSVYNKLSKATKHQVTDKKRAWLPEHDVQLQELVKHHGGPGIKAFRKAAKQMGRTVSAVESRWNQVLFPKKRRVPNAAEIALKKRQAERKKLEDEKKRKEKEKKKRRKKRASAKKKKAAKPTKKRASAKRKVKKPGAKKKGKRPSAKKKEKKPGPVRKLIPVETSQGDVLVPMTYEQYKMYEPKFYERQMLKARARERRKEEEEERDEEAKQRYLAIKADRERQAGKKRPKSKKH